MKTGEFDYELPQGLIAQTAVEPRDHSRLLVLSRKDGGIQHRRFYELPQFLRRVEAQYADHRRQAQAQASALKAQQQSKAAAVATVQRQVQAAGITPQGLAGLIDVCPRAGAAQIKGKLAELDVERRNLRVFETANPKVLLVIENGEAGRSEYAIERDEGLVADLKLFAQGTLC